MPLSDNAKAYLSKLEVYFLMLCAVVVTNLAGYLMTKYLGKPADLPPVPVATQGAPNVHNCRCCCFDVP